MSSGNSILVIGGGIAGMQAAVSLASFGYDPVIVERHTALGGHVAGWDRLFPSRRPGPEVIEFLRQQMNDNIRILLETEVIRTDYRNGRWEVQLSGGDQLTVEAILVTTGFDLFQARKKEEYGYGIYDNVITSADLEIKFNAKETIRNNTGKIPSRVGFVHCVGSRDEKVGNLYCSRVCCVTAVKQAIEIKEMIPESEVFCFYMDLRMFGLDFEALYKEAQEKGIQFIRGRLSESFENADGSVMVKVEDTLANKPFRMNVDLLVLMSGMVPSEGTENLKALLGLETDENQFLQPKDRQIQANDTASPGVFLAGTCTSPKSIDETLADSRSAVIRIMEYLKAGKPVFPGRSGK